MTASSGAHAESSYWAWVWEQGGRELFPEREEVAVESRGGCDWTNHREGRGWGGGRQTAAPGGIWPPHSLPASTAYPASFLSSLASCCLVVGPSASPRLSAPPALASIPTNTPSLSAFLLPPNP